MCDPETGDFKGAIQVIMSNQGRLPSVTEEEQKRSQSMSPQKNRVQPAQGEDKKSKYKKVVKSRPMDLTKQQETNNTTNIQATHGGLATENFNKSIMSQMNQSQVSFATTNNADLRKKLRVDRVKKQTMG